MLQEVLVVDTDPFGSALLFNLDPDPGWQKMTRKKREKNVKKYFVMRCCMFSFQYWRPRNKYIAMFLI
jgi:hypothetical protein